MEGNRRTASQKEELPHHLSGCLSVLSTFREAAGPAALGTRNSFRRTASRTVPQTPARLASATAPVQGPESRQSQPQRSYKCMNITRRIHLNPQSKGNLGKSFEAEFRVAWLDRLGIQWNGSDLDDRHHTFASRHPHN